MRENNPAVQAILRLAEPEVTTTVTIYRNTDANLPASHMVEVEFVGALGSTAIQRVPALVLKSTEQARGEPLAGAAVPVTDDLFWIALSDDTQEVTRNITLLREGDWFDIPILFTDGTRALLTFEKGIPGDLVFENVLAAWPRREVPFCREPTKPRPCVRLEGSRSSKPASRPSVGSRDAGHGDMYETDIPPRKSTASARSVKSRSGWPLERISIQGAWPRDNGHGTDRCVY